VVWLLPWVSDAHAGPLTTLKPLDCHRAIQRRHCCSFRASRVRPRDIAVPSFLEGLRHSRQERDSPDGHEDQKVKDKIKAWKALSDKEQQFVSIRRVMLDEKGLEALQPLP
jgi:hypothetical protein